MCKTVWLGKNCTVPCNELIWLVNPHGIPEKNTIMIGLAEICHAMA